VSRSFFYSIKILIDRKTNMQVLNQILFAVQIISALAMIFLILLQHGKGADMGAAFGSGSSGSLFGASGSANFLSRLTGVLATVFFVCTLGLAYTSGVRPSGSGSVLEKAAVPAPASSAVPAAPAASGAQAIPTAPSGAAVVPTAPAAPAAPTASGAQPIPTPAK
jgi:preprotein translocase subunit SecG